MGGGGGGGAGGGGNPRQGESLDKDKTKQTVQLLPATSTRRASRPADFRSCHSWFPTFYPPPIR